MQQIAGPYYIYFATIKPKPVKANESLNMKLFIRLAHIFRVVQSQIISCIWQRAYLNRMTIDNWHRRRITDVLGKVLLFGVGARASPEIKEESGSYSHSCFWEASLIHMHSPKQILVSSFSPSSPSSPPPPPPPPSPPPPPHIAVSTGIITKATTNSIALVVVGHLSKVNIKSAHWSYHLIL